MSSILIAALANVLIAASLTAFDRTRGDRTTSRRKLQLAAVPLRRGRAAPSDAAAKNRPHR